jgi:hypothetical protein
MVRRTSEYSVTAKALHWLTVALLVAQFIFAWTMPDLGRTTPMTSLISLHFLELAKFLATTRHLDGLLPPTEQSCGNALRPTCPRAGCSL